VQRIRIAAALIAGIVTAVCLAAPAGAQALRDEAIAAVGAGAPEAPGRPWDIWDYGTAARCVWGPDREPDVSALEVELRGENSTVLQAEFERCSHIEGLAGRQYSHKMFVNALVMQAYQYAARCALKNLADLNLQEIKGLRSAARSDPANFVLPPAIDSAVSTCDKRIFHWYPNRTLVNDQVLQTLVAQRAWIDQLAEWKSDPMREAPATRLTLCLLEKDETGVVTFVTVLNSLPVGQKARRAAALLPLLAAPCAVGVAAMPSPEAVVTEITEFYLTHFDIVDRY
jgi:hypothetical protein